MISITKLALRLLTNSVSNDVNPVNVPFRMAVILFRFSSLTKKTLRVKQLINMWLCNHSTTAACSLNIPIGSAAKC